MGGFAEWCLPSVTLGKEFAKCKLVFVECKLVFAECNRHSAKRLNPVVRALLGRHCGQHLGRDIEEYMLMVMEDNYPGLAAGFQRTVFRAGLLRFLNLHLLM